jgi:hypothetical protein
MAHDTIVESATRVLFIGLSTCRGKEVPPLGDIFLSFLSSDLHLLILTTSPELISLESFVFVA